jgi:hypothetical protein
MGCCGKTASSCHVSTGTAKVRGFAILSNMSLTILRARNIGSALPQSITKSNEPLQSTIQNLFKSVEQDLQGINAYHY